MSAFISGPTGGDAPIAGLSEKVAQITVYYERHGWSARVSNRYRSENRQYITTFGPPNQGGDVSPNGGFSMAQPESVVDALKKGEDVRLVGFGTFLPVNRAPGTARNPRTGQTVARPASKTARFRVGEGLKGSLNG